DHEHDLARSRGAAVVVVAELRRPGPGVKRRDVAKPLASLVVGAARRVEVATDVPELAEAGAAVVARVLAPEELARELVVEARHVRLDEGLVRLEQRDAV